MSSQGSTAAAGKGQANRSDAASWQAPPRSPAHHSPTKRAMARARRQTRCTSAAALRRRRVGELLGVFDEPLDQHAGLGVAQSAGQGFVGQDELQQGINRHSSPSGPSRTGGGGSSHPFTVGTTREGGAIAAKTPPGDNSNLPEKTSVDSRKWQTRSGRQRTGAGYPALSSFEGILSCAIRGRRCPGRLARCASPERQA